MRRLFRVLRRVLFYLLVGVTGFVVGLITVYVILLDHRPDLQPWHTARLTEEFTAERADEVRTLDAYLEVERALFEELDEEIYAKVGTGAGFALVRFSTGSAADPRRFTVNWNHTFEMPADEPIGGALLLHGLSDSPYSVRAIGESLHAQGYHVLALRLPGHGTAPCGLTTVRWEDMAAAVRLGARHLRARLPGRPIHFVGYSNGAALALDHCLAVLDGEAEGMPASLVLISPEIGLSPIAAFAGWQAELARLPGLGKAAWTDITPEFDPFKYGSFAVNAGVQAYELTESIAARLARHSATGKIADLPRALVFVSAVDATVSVDAVVDVLLTALAPGRGELVVFDVNRAEVASTVMVNDPGPLTARLMADAGLPFAMTLVTNENPDSLAVVEHEKDASTARFTTEPLGVSWPVGVLSLSHVALPFPADDPLYGAIEPDSQDLVYLGRIDVQGERGLLLFPSDWLMRIRHNPFFPVLERRALDWVRANDRAPR